MTSALDTYDFPKMTSDAGEAYPSYASIETDTSSKTFTFSESSLCK